MTDAQLLERFTEISETNLFPVQFGDGTILTGLPPNDIYQLGFFAAFNACHLAVREYVDQALVMGILEQKRAPLTVKCPRCGKSRLEAKFEICCM